MIHGNVKSRMSGDSEGARGKDVTSRVPQMRWALFRVSVALRVGRGFSRPLRRGCVKVLSAFGLALLTTVGCDPGEAKLVQLNDEELQVALRGNEMTFDVVVDDAGAMQFGCNNAWSAVGGNVGNRGKFEINGDQYCIVSMAGNNPSCHRMFRDASGALYTQGVGPSSEGRRYPLAKVKLRRLSQC